MHIPRRPSRVTDPSLSIYLSIYFFTSCCFCIFFLSYCFFRVLFFNSCGKSGRTVTGITGCGIPSNTTGESAFIQRCACVSYSSISSIHNPMYIDVCAVMLRYVRVKFWGVTGLNELRCVVLRSLLLFLGEDAVLSGSACILSPSLSRHCCRTFCVPKLSGCARRVCHDGVSWRIFFVICFLVFPAIFKGKKRHLQDYW